MDDLQEIRDRLHDVFTPASPISDARFLRGRGELLEDIDTAIKRKGASIVLYGERGVGKSSIAKIAAQFAVGSPFYYSASANDTFESIALALLDRYGVCWVPESRGTERRIERGGAVGIPGMSVSANAGEARAETESRMGRTSVTAQEVASRLPQDAKLVIIDEFERIQATKERQAFADLIKKLSDNESPTTLMLVGVAESIDELLEGHESAHRSIVEIRVDRLKNEFIKEIIEVGSEALGIDFAPDITEQIVDFSAQFPYYTHLLGEGAVTALLGNISDGRKSTLLVEQDELASSIAHAIRNAHQSISRTFEDATRSIHDSPRFKYALYAIASWPEEPIPYREVSHWVGALTGNPQGVNVSHQLKRLESAGVIHRPAPGFYKFRNPLLKAYVILKARMDTPGNELRAIDAQLNQVKKRLDRMRVGGP